jgi:dynein heavy chain
MEESRKITNDINNKLSAAKHIEDRLEENRKILKPLAVLATKLFFVSQSLSCLDPMYRYSMAWFISLFNSIFAKTEEKKKEEEVKQTNKKSNRRTSLISGAGSDAKLAKEIKATRVNQLKKKFRELFYIRVQMSLFEQHKLLLSFYIAIKLNEPS